MAVQVVSPADFLLHLFHSHIRMTFCQFLKTANRPCMNRGCKKNFYICIRQNCGTNIPAIQNDSPFFCLFPLNSNHGFPYTSNSRHHRHMGRNLRCTDIRSHIISIHKDFHIFFSRPYFHLQIFRHGNDVSFAFYLAGKGFIGHCSVHSPCIEISIVKSCSQDFRNATFACPCRPIDSNR